MAQIYKVFKETIPLVLHDIPLFLYDRQNYVYLKVETQDECRAMVESFWEAEGLKGISLYSPDLQGFKEKFKANFNLVDAAGGVVFDDAGRLLVIRRNGYFDLPKGHLKDREAHARAAVREVAEECGIPEPEITGTTPKHTYHLYEKNGKRYLKNTWWYKMHATGTSKPVPQKEEGIEDARWMEKSEVEARLNEFYPSLLDLLGEELK